MIMTLANKYESNIQACSCNCVFLLGYRHVVSRSFINA